MSIFGKVLCHFGKHNYYTRTRTAPPAIGREEKRCKRCNTYEIVENVDIGREKEDPKFHKEYNLK